MLTSGQQQAVKGREQYAPDGSPHQERNKGFSFTNNYINSPGRAPVIMQPVQGEVRIKIKGDFDIYSLDINGERLAKISSFKQRWSHGI